MPPGDKKKDIATIRSLRPKKGMGQNFLIDDNVLGKLGRLMDIHPSDTILEIGPGMGHLTQILLEKNACVVAVEKDRRLCGILREKFGRRGNLDIVNEDILRFDPAGLAGKSKIKVAGNLPYSITSPIMTWMMNNRRIIDTAYIMVQKEISLRMTSSKGKDFGPLSCFVRLYCEPEFLMPVKRNSFYPAPEVESAVLRLKFLDKPSVSLKSEDMFFKVVKSGFNKRRKTVHNSLAGSVLLNLPKEIIHEALTHCQINPSSRAEELSLRQFACLSDFLSEHRN
jgi:16S rRNA (adenine1518-N6/adenine1519-N6)-dimethyltransferase